MAIDPFGAVIENMFSAIFLGMKELVLLACFEHLPQPLTARFPASGAGSFICVVLR